MATAMFHKSIATIQLNSSGNEWSTCKKLGKYPLKIISKAFVVDVGGSFIYGQSNFVLVGSALILIRHGDSLWNENNLFTGCVDVPLTKKGIEEAVEACRRISNIPVDMIYTSLLIRLQMTAMLVMTNTAIKRSIQNNVPIFFSNYVPIIIRKESDRAKEWSQYGELQGHNKLETAEKYGKEKVHEWRRSCNSPPANGESLKMCSQRAVAYFREHKMQLNRSLYFATCRVLPFTGRHWMHCFSNTCRKETTNRRVVVGFLAMYRALADLYANW
ncbi:2,3-bisphosphoglycerate-dependent phosphoglycerate mutase [Gossypium arboreum]|uniref:phosphoglycerate mutase (2,3-diphosphoglycerate-dependent) n=1 Tax=Gossypium arboreum TaxID=29729 RepID=A0A0B0PYF1_GOSAR|nr:2,3-bisphosphoglycerate-dependent phosphoglycerate mutase [Gossypium arboreum]